MKMRSIFGMCGLACGCALTSPALADDECADATVIEPNSSTPFSTTMATESDDQHDGSLCRGTAYTATGPDIWMRIDLASAGLLTLSTCDSSSFDTDLTLYAGNCDLLEAVACNGDSDPDGACQQYFSSLTYDATPGTYLVRIGGWNAATGSGTLTSEFASNDDCDLDGVPDDEEPDCDEDGTPDDCEFDCNDNGIPDDCEKGNSDCNDNGIDDSCDIAEGSSSDLNNNGTPDECEAATISVPFDLTDAIGGECIPNGPLAVNMSGVVIGAQVDVIFTNGGDFTWAADALLCMANPDGTGCIQLGGFNLDCVSGCPNQTVFPASWNVTDSGEYSVYIPLAEFGFQGEGDYTFDLCHGYAQGSAPTSWNGTVTFFYLPDTFIDCNDNGVADDMDIAEGTSTDCDSNGVPDECQTNEDCDSDGVPDICQTGNDCNGNGTPDACEEFVDCNGNDIFDACETDNDCDGNGIPDDCQKPTDCNDNGIFDACETDNDCNGNGTPDECETENDCNQNGIPDDCEKSDDCDGNGVPDACELDGGDLDDNGVLDRCEGPLADNCNNPLSIEPNAVTFFNSNGATDSGIADDDSLCPDTFYTNAEPDVWFKLTLDNPGTLELSTCYQGSFDTDLALYTGNGCGNIVKVACNGDVDANEDCQDYHSELSYEAEPGRYWIRIGGYNGAVGSGFLTSSFDGETASCPGDFDGSGTVNGGDFGILLAAWGNCEGCPQDLNGDNKVNGADVGLFLALWGACP